MQTKDKIFNLQRGEKSSPRGSDYKILHISDNSLETYMVEKYLPTKEGYKILKANSLMEGIKIINYLSLDLIIIDDNMIHNRLDEIVVKLSNINLKQKIPLLIILSEDYDESKFPKYNRHIDFVKRPIDRMIFTHRANLLIDNARGNLAKRSYFKELANERFLEASSYLLLYHDIFDLDENMMLIFDKKMDKFIETNKAFEKNFTNVRVLNRIFKSKRAIKATIPYIDEPNYINYYDFDEWIELLTKNREFNFSIKIKLSYQEYSFSLIVKKLYLENRDIYLIKLIDIFAYSATKSKKESVSLQLKEDNLYAFRDDFISLRDLIRRVELRDKKSCDELLYRLSSKLSIICDDSSLIEDREEDRESNKLQNLYEITHDRLNSYSKNREIFLNSNKLDELDKNQRAIYAKVDKSSFEQIIDRLIEHTEGRVDLMIYETNETVILEYAYDSHEKMIKKESFGELINKLNLLIEIVHEEQKSIVVINLPKNI